MLERLNLQLREPVAHGDGKTLDVIDIWKTIQGEGPLAGCRAVFIRLAGCNLDCPGCDTNYTNDRHRMMTSEVSVTVANMLEPHDIIVITGGEPFRQNIGQLVRALYLTGNGIQIETNGSCFPDDFPRSAAMIVCSPKTPKVHPKLARMIDSYKYVLDADHVNPHNGLPTNILGIGAPAYPPPDFPRHAVYVQPYDDGNPCADGRHLKACVDSCLKFGWRLGIQLHKQPYVNLK